MRKILFLLLLKNVFSFSATAVVVCYLPSSDSLFDRSPYDNLCKQTELQLKESGYKTVLASCYSSKDQQCAVKAVPSDGNPFVVTIGHGNSTDGKHILSRGAWEIPLQPNTLKS